MIDYDKLDAEKLHIGIMIREARIKKGMSLGQVSEQTGMAETTIGRLEEGRYWPSMKQYAAILQAIGCRVCIYNDAE